MDTLEMKLVPTSEGIDACTPAIGQVLLFSTWENTLTEGTVIGQVRTLRTTRALVMPEGGPWTVRQRYLQGREAGLGVGAPVLSLRLLDAEADAAQADAEAKAGRVYPSPMAGQYYRRPAPDQPPFVEVGSILKPGTQIGLVEVMKFFYPLVFEGQGVWKVTELLVGESTSLEAGDPVLRMEAYDG